MIGQEMVPLSLLQGQASQLMGGETSVELHTMLDLGRSRRRQDLLQQWRSRTSCYAFVRL